MINDLTTLLDERSMLTSMVRTISIGIWNQFSSMVVYVSLHVDIDVSYNLWTLKCVLVICEYLDNSCKSSPHSLFFFMQQLFPIFELYVCGHLFYKTNVMQNQQSILPSRWVFWSMIVRIFPLRKPNSIVMVMSRLIMILPWKLKSSWLWYKKEKKGKTLLQVKFILFAFCFRLYIVKILYLVLLDYFVEFYCILKRFSKTSLIKKKCYLRIDCVLHRYWITK